MNSPEYVSGVTTESSEMPRSCCSSEPPNTFETDMIAESFYPDKITTPSPVMPQKWEEAKAGKNVRVNSKNFNQDDQKHKSKWKNFSFFPGTKGGILVLF